MGRLSRLRPTREGASPSSPSLLIFDSKTPFQLASDSITCMQNNVLVGNTAAGTNSLISYSDVGGGGGRDFTFLHSPLLWPVFPPHIFQIQLEKIKMEGWTFRFAVLVINVMTSGRIWKTFLHKLSKFWFNWLHSLMPYIKQFRLPTFLFCVFHNGTLWWY